MPLEHMAHAIKEFVEFLERYGEVTADGHVTELEGRSLERDAQDAIQQILYVVEQAKLMRAAQPAKASAM